MGFRDGRVLKELKQKSRKVLVYRNGDVSIKEFLGEGDYIGNVTIEELSEFLNKFGRILYIDDLTARLFDQPRKSWEIDFQLLYSGYLFLAENREQFERAVKGSRNAKEFMTAYGVR